MEELSVSPEEESSSVEELTHEFTTNIVVNSGQNVLQKITAHFTDGGSRFVTLNSLNFSLEQVIRATLEQMIPHPTLPRTVRLAKESEEYLNTLPYAYIRDSYKYNSKRGKRRPICAEEVQDDRRNRNLIDLDDSTELSSRYSNTNAIDPVLWHLYHVKCAKGSRQNIYTSFLHDFLYGDGVTNENEIVSWTFGFNNRVYSDSLKISPNNPVIERYKFEGTNRSFVQFFTHELPNLMMADIPFGAYPERDAKPVVSDDALVEMDNVNETLKERDLTEAKDDSVKGEFWVWYHVQKGHLLAFNEYKEPSLEFTANVNWYFGEKKQKWELTFNRQRMEDLLWFLQDTDTAYALFQIVMNHTAAKISKHGELKKPTGKQEDEESLGMFPTDPIEDDGDVSKENYSLQDPLVTELLAMNSDAEDVTVPATFLETSASGNVVQIHQKQKRSRKKKGKKPCKTTTSATAACTEEIVQASENEPADEATHTRDSLPITSSKKVAPLPEEQDWNVIERAPGYVEMATKKKTKTKSKSKHTSASKVDEHTVTPEQPHMSISLTDSEASLKSTPVSTLKSIEVSTGRMTQSTLATSANNTNVASNRSQAQYPDDKPEILSRAAVVAASNDLQKAMLSSEHTEQEKTPKEESLSSEGTKQMTSAFISDNVDGLSQPHCSGSKLAIITSRRNSETSPDTPISAATTIPVSNDTQLGHIHNPVSVAPPPAKESIAPSKTASIANKLPKMTLRKASVAKTGEVVSAAHEHELGMSSLVVAKEVGQLPNESLSTKSSDVVSPQQNNDKTHINDSPAVPYIDPSVLPGGAHFSHAPGIPLRPGAHNFWNDEDHTPQKIRPASTRNVALYTIQNIKFGDIESGEQANPDALYNPPMPPMAGYEGYEWKTPVPIIDTLAGPRHGHDVLLGRVPKQLSLEDHKDVNITLRQGFIHKCRNCGSKISDIPNDQLSSNPREVATICNGCGPCSDVRYCNVTCLLADSLDHRQVCRKVPINFPLDLRSVPSDSWKTAMFYIKPVNEGYSAERFRQIAYCAHAGFTPVESPFYKIWQNMTPADRAKCKFKTASNLYVGRGDYFIFVRPEDCSTEAEKSIVQWALRFEMHSNEQEIFIRARNAAFYDALPKYVEFLYFYIRQKIFDDVSTNKIKSMDLGAQLFKAAIEQLQRETGYDTSHLDNVPYAATEEQAEENGGWEIKAAERKMAPHLFVMEIQVPVLRLWAPFRQCYGHGRDYVPKAVWDHYKTGTQEDGETCWARATTCDSFVPGNIESEPEDVKRGWLGKRRDYWMYDLDYDYSRLCRVEYFKMMMEHDGA